MGTTALIRSIRLQRARSLLQHSRMSVEQIAAAVGYRDATALRRLVRKASGTTPVGLRALTAMSASSASQTNRSRRDRA